MIFRKLCGPQFYEYHIYEGVTKSFPSYELLICSKQARVCGGRSDPQGVYTLVCDPVRRRGEFTTSSSL
jgi:hypothetical protein